MNGYTKVVIHFKIEGLLEPFCATRCNKRLRTNHPTFKEYRKIYLLLFIFNKQYNILYAMESIDCSISFSP